MTNLTEQYQKGELPVGAYYVKYYNDSISPSIDIYRRIYSLKKESELKFTINQIEEVLAEVPSYEEYKNLISRSIALGELDEMFANEQEKNADLQEENAKLKNLLKECLSPINYALCLNLSEEEKIEFKNLLAKIKQLLGEE